MADLKVGDHVVRTDRKWDRDLTGDIGQVVAVGTNYRTGEPMVRVKWLSSRVRSTVQAKRLRFMSEEDRAERNRRIRALDEKRRQDAIERDRKREEVTA